jgi:hypothetical protein
MKLKKIYILILSFVFSSSVFAFGNGFTLGIRAYPSATFTLPHISKEDMAYLGGNGMKGMLGYITTGSAELTYLFDSVRYFGYQDASIFSGLGLAGYFGVGQGFSGQISGQYNEIVGDINVYCRVYMKATLNMGTTLKTFLFNNRMSINFGLGLNMLLDPHPTYELTTNLSTEDVDKLLKSPAHLDFSNETGTLLITDEMMKKMNPVGYVFNFGLEYYQPVTSHMKLTLGGFLSYTIYKPGYVSLPQKLAEAAKKGALAETPSRTLDLSKPIKSFYMNALNFGLSVGLVFDV